MSDIPNLTYEQYNEKGTEFENDGDGLKALSYFTKAFELEPKNPIAIKNIVSTLIILKKYPEGLKLVDLGLELEPENAYFWFHKCRILDKIGKNDEADTCRSKAVELDPHTNWKRVISGYKMIDMMESLVDSTEQEIQESEIRSKKLEEFNATLDRMIKSSKAKRTTDFNDDDLPKTSESYEKTHTYYDILGVTKNASSSEIKDRFRELSVKFHPDKEPSALSSETMKKIIEAYDTLKDPEKRNAYDQTLS